VLRLPLETTRPQDAQISTTVNSGILRARVQARNHTRRPQLVGAFGLGLNPHR